MSERTHPCSQLRLGTCSIVSSPFEWMFYSHSHEKWWAVHTPWAIYYPSIRYTCMSVGRKGYWLPLDDTCQLSPQCHGIILMLNTAHKHESMDQIYEQVKSSQLKRRSERLQCQSLIYALLFKILTYYRVKLLETHWRIAIFKNWIKFRWILIEIF